MIVGYCTYPRCYPNHCPVFIVLNERVYPPLEGVWLAVNRDIIGVFMGGVMDMRGAREHWELWGTYEGWVLGEEMGNLGGGRAPEFERGSIVRCVWGRCLADPPSQSIVFHTTIFVSPSSVSSFTCN